MELSFEKVTLPNGLDVIYHQERSLPVVSVNVWYHVGSKDEEAGKTGFAHLFEHIMFEGTKHHNASHFEPLQKVGALLNGSTNNDRTNYWENVPSNYLELALWLEADRMGYLLDALDQRRFDIQRDVVKNERRQSYENRPYGMASLRLQDMAYPTPHPYHWPTIGYHEDLDNASLDDVRAFFQRFYIPNNASLSIAGDFDLDKTKELVYQYFADLPAGPPVPRQGRMDSPLQGQSKSVLYDTVLLPRVFVTWPTVPRFHDDEAPLAVLASILSDGRSSRLHKSLVYEKRIAQSVSAHHGASEIAGLWYLDITAASGHSLEEVEETAMDELQKLKIDAPLPEEIERIKNQIERGTVGQLAHIGGFGGRANRLNSFNVFTGDPENANRDLGRFRSVQSDDVLRVASSYLGSRRVHLSVLPEPTRTFASSSIDRTIEPAPEKSRPFAPPSPKRAVLANGLRLMVVEKPGLPLVAFGLVLDAGSVTDPHDKPGLAAFTTAMLQEGTSSRSSQKIADEFEFMGTQLTSNTGREQTFLAAETLTKHWPDALEILADLVQRANFPEHELERLRQERLTTLRRLRDDATSIAARLAPMLLYGKDSPYGHPVLGTEDVLKNITQGDLIRRFAQNFTADKATLVVAGDVTLGEVQRCAQQHFGTWAASENNASASTDEKIAESKTTTIYLLDKPGAAQSVIRAGHVAAARSHADYFPLIVFNYIFGGQFTARLNMNLRQDKGYSYGYNSSIDWHKSSSLLMAGGGVQTNVTTEAVLETLKEFTDIQESRPIAESEFQASKDSLLRQFPASFETSPQILGQLGNIVLFDLPDDYYSRVPASIGAVTLEDVRRVAREHVASDALTILVVGDREKIEAGLRNIGFPLNIVDPEGNKIGT